MVVGKIENCLDGRTSRLRVGNGLRVECGQMNFGAAEHREMTVGFDVPPTQIEEPLAAFTMNEWPTEVQTPRAISHRVNREREDGRRCITRNDPDDLFPALHPDVDRVPLSASQSGKIMTDNAYIYRRHCHLRCSFHGRSSVRM